MSMYINAYIHVYAVIVRKFEMLNICHCCDKDMLENDMWYYGWYIGMYDDVDTDIDIWTCITGSLICKKTGSQSLVA